MNILKALTVMEGSKRHINYTSCPGDYSETYEHYDWKDLPGGGRQSTKRRFTSKAAEEVATFLNANEPIWEHDLASNLKTGKYTTYKSADTVAAYKLPGGRAVIIRGRFRPMHWKSGGIELHSHKVVPLRTLGSILDTKADRLEGKARRAEADRISLQDYATRLRSKAIQFYD